MVIELLLVLGLVWLTGGASSAPLAKPGCPHTCGNITIPYPFGIGVGCYANDSFAITCDNSSNPPKPFFTTYNHFEVLDIYLFAGFVYIHHPVLAYDCPNGTNVHRLANLSSPFWFSEDYNVFTATGCNNLALMMSQDQQIIGGCASLCNHRDNSNSTARGSCYGIKCCQPPSGGVRNLRLGQDL
ncbi:wall-associated receptor kinase-like 8 [Cornus florida]|uniref:wall-associated receptor kinase-like 8 n=1 Tax=Cornus florida TaxID=4283 RepID=UPI00289C1792|nr:wall-associated receptor kinase-like 8 [Cornus florida]